MPSLGGFRQLRGHANFVVWLLVATAFVSGMSIVYELQMQSLLGDLAVGRPIVAAHAAAIDDTISLIAGLSFVALVVTGGAFIAWFHRAYVNIERLGARDLRATSGWSIAAWFVPVMNLVRPKQLMDDIWRASDPELPGGELRGWRTAPVRGLLHVWWALYLLQGLASYVALRAIDGADTVAERTTAGKLGMLADAGSIAAVVAAILVVRATTARQEQRAARIGPGAPPAPGASATVYPSPLPSSSEFRPHSIPPPIADSI